MPLARRLGLCILLAGSLFGMAGCIMRLVTAHESNLYRVSWGMLWAGIEQCLVIALGSVPTPPALRQIKIGFIHNLGSSLASLVDLRNHWRSGHGSKSGGQGSPSGMSSGEEKAPTNTAICERACPTDVDVEAARRTISANDRNLYDSYEVMADEFGSEHPLHSASAHRYV